MKIKMGQFGAICLEHAKDKVICGEDWYKVVDSAISLLTWLPHRFDH